MAAAPGVAALIVLNAVRYGGPLASGYGDAATLFSWTHVTANAPRYARWMLATHTPFVLLAAAAPWLLRDGGRRRLAVVSLAGVALLAATYLAYTVFDDWWYIRFLLPAVPVLIALSVAAARAAVAEWWPGPAGRSLVLAACAVLALWFVHVARTRSVLEIHRLESRFALAGDYARRELPEIAVVIAGQESGSIRFHGRRDTLAWDALAADALDRTIAALQRRGRLVYLALEDAEEPAFRRRFPGERAGRLDWAPAVELPAPVRVRVYDARGAGR
jgi:hypothetical protein